MSPYTTNNGPNDFLTLNPYMDFRSEEQKAKWRGRVMGDAMAVKVVASLTGDRKLDFGPFETIDEAEPFVIFDDPEEIDVVFPLTTKLNGRITENDGVFNFQIMENMDEN